jgi:hypothetical protein
VYRDKGSIQLICWLGDQRTVGPLLHDVNLKSHSFAQSFECFSGKKLRSDFLVYAEAIRQYRLVDGSTKGIVVIDSLCSSE